MITLASVRQKGMKRGAENKLAKALGFEYADVRDFVVHLELDATCSADLALLREMNKVLHDGGSIEAHPFGGEATKVEWKSMREADAS